MKTSTWIPFPARFFALILVVVFSVAAGQPLGAAQEPGFRLPDIARTTRYQLDLTILPDQPTFQGTAIIGVDLKERTGVIWLNAKDLTVSAIKVTADVTRPSARWHTTVGMLAVQPAKAE